MRSLSGSVIGMRRSGKSCILKMISEEILTRNSNNRIIYINKHSLFFVLIVLILKEKGIWNSLFLKEFQIIILNMSFLWINSIKSVEMELF